MANSGEPFAKSRYEKAFTEDASVWKDASPITYVAPDKGIPPFLLVHAGKRQASADQAKELAAALQKAGVRAEVFHNPDRNHLTLNSAIGRNGDATTKAIQDFVSSVVSAPPQPAPSE